MSTLESPIQKNAAPSQEGHEQEGLESQEQEGLEGQAFAAETEDTAQLKRMQSAANNSPQVQQLRAIQRAVSQSFQVQHSAQLRAAAAQYAGPAQPLQRVAANNTGLPDQLKSGIEDLSGMAMDDVKVHYNSSKPADVGAHAYAQGSDIHVAPGQEQHLPHEAWHVVQQKQGRVAATRQLKGIGINDDEGLEREADEMGAKAVQMKVDGNVKQMKSVATSGTAIQRMPQNIVDPTNRKDGLHWDKRDMTQAGLTGTSVPSHVIGVMNEGGDGGAPSVSIPGWTWLQNKLGRVKGQWVRFHLINQLLGGPGYDSRNLVPASNSVNTNFNNDIEEPAKYNAIKKQKWTYVEVSLVYNSNWVPAIPQTIQGEWGTWNAQKACWEQQDVKKYNNPDITFYGTGLNYIRGTGITQDQLAARGVPSKYLKDLQNWLRNYSRNSDNDFAFMRDAENEFGEDFNTDWLSHVWLDEDDQTPGTYVPVLKAAEVKKRKSRYVPKNQKKKAKKSKFDPTALNTVNLKNRKTKPKPTFTKKQALKLANANKNKTTV
jgi:hypothetical protein